MNSFWTLIPRNMAKNKKKAAFIGVGIILSICLIISLSIMLDILKKSSYERMINQSGGVYDIQFFTSDRNSLSLLEKDPSINKASVSINLGTYKLPNSKYAIDINGYDKNITEFINYKLKQGRYPENENEIAIEDWILEKLPKKYKIGDKISLPSIISYTNSKGKPGNLNIDNQLTLVGTFQYIIEQNGEKNKAEAYVTRKYAEAKLTTELIKYNGYLIINPKNTIDKSLELLTSTDEYEKIYFNKNFSKAMLLKSFKTIDFVSVVLYIVISLVASVIIYNIFNISVTERIKEFGILRAIGSSPGQIKMLVFGEGLILGCIFIPIGIIIGNIVVKSIIALISGYKDFSGIFKIPSSGIITSFAVGFLSIILGTYAPARRASKISPIEAISSQNNLGLTSKKLKKRLQKRSVMGKFFGFTADMAYLNLNRNRKRFITTVISLSISIIMFLTVSYLINCTDPIKNLRNKLGGDFIITSTSSLQKDSLTDKDIQDIENIKNIGQISKQKRIQTTMTVPEGQVTSEGLKSLEKESKKTLYAKHQFEQKIYSFYSVVFGSTEEDINNIKDYMIQGKIDSNKMNKEPFVILAENLNYSNNTKLNAGDKIKLSHPSYDSDGNYIKDIDETFTIMAVLNNNYTSPDAQINNVVIMSSQAAEKYMGLSGYQQIKINLSKNSNYEEIEKSLKDKIKNNRGVTLTSYKEELEKTKKSNKQTSLIMYSFVIVVAAVSIINLFNIMSMNVMLRKKEIGMLRAIGFENNQVVKMIRFEGIYYGITSALWGIGLGVLFTFIFYLAARKSFLQGMTWSFPTITVILTILITILICLISSINASRKLFESSIVDSIRCNE